MSYDEKRHQQHMRKVRTKNTRYELLLREFVCDLGYVEELEDEASLDFRPDIVIPEQRIAIFMHGCFWHRHFNCRFAYDVDRAKYPDWTKKFADNVARDKSDINRLRALGWRSLIVWECALNAKKRRAIYLPIIGEWLSSQEQFGEIPATPPLTKRT